MSGPEEPVSDFRVESLHATRGRDGRPVVLAQVRNTGARALDLRRALSAGPGGLAAGPFPATLGATLNPGDASPVSIVLDKAIAGGPWTATLTLRSGLLERRAEATITFSTGVRGHGAGCPARPLPLARDPSVVVPVAGALVGLLVLVLVVVGYLTSRRRAPERRLQQTPT